MRNNKSVELLPVELDSSFQRQPLALLLEQRRCRLREWDGFPHNDLSSGGMGWDGESGRLVLNLDNRASDSLEVSYSQIESDRSIVGELDRRHISPLVVHFTRQSQSRICLLFCKCRSWACPRYPYGRHVHHSRQQERRET